jgi:hypothetical protein
METENLQHMPYKPANPANRDTILSLRPTGILRELLSAQAVCLLQKWEEAINTYYVMFARSPSQ